MKFYTTIVQNQRSLGCTVQSNDETFVDAPQECSLIPEALIYGVCRYITKSAALRNVLIPASYRFRLPRKKTKGSRRMPTSKSIWLDIPCGYLTLANCKILVNLTVTAEGIILNRVLVKESEFRLKPFAWESFLVIKEGDAHCA